MRPQLPEGVHARVTHLRYPERFGAPMGTLKNLKDWGERPRPKGGETIAILVDDEGNKLSEATAKCSELDNYSRQIGRDIATGRAIKALPY